MHASIRVYTIMIGEKASPLKVDRTNPKDCRKYFGKI